MPNDDWKNLTNGSFKGVPFHVAIPSRAAQYGVENEEFAIERRLQIIKRPLLDGAPIRDWGADPETYNLSIEFFGVNYSANAEKFLKVLNEGTPGTLITPTIPKAVLAYFWKRTRAARFQEGNTIKITVTFINAKEIDSPGVATVKFPDKPDVDKSKADVDKDIDNSLTVLQDNVFLTALREANHNISQVRSAVNAVTTLAAGIQSKILNEVGQLTGLLGQLKSATTQIQSIFSLTIPALVPASQSLGTNSETGQTITDFSEPDTIPTPVNAVDAAIAAASAAINPPAPAIPTNNLTSLPGVAKYSAAVIASLTQSKASLATDSGGRTDDVSKSLTAVINSFSKFAAAVAGTPPATFETLVDQSLGEILFINAIDLSELRERQKDNPDVTDPFFVPKGTILAL